jgi:hypothetical protein
MFSNKFVVQKNFLVFNIVFEKSGQNWEISKIWFDYFQNFQNIPNPNERWVAKYFPSD